MSSNLNETKRRILDAARRLLESGEANAVRMSDIAREAELSRQAVYLHYPTRAELLTATVRYLDEIKDVDSRLAASRAAESGVERLDAFVTAWGGYIPEIYGVARAMLAMKDTDAAAAAAWADRMAAVYDGCRAAVQALSDDDRLSPDYTVAQASDILWTLLSVRNWEQLTIERNWSQKRYLDTTRDLARKCLVVST